MTMQTGDYETSKNIRFYRKQGVLSLPVRFIRILGWERFQNLFMVRTEDNRLIITDEKNFTKIKLNEGFRIFKARVTGSNNTTGHYNYRVQISKELFDLMELHKNGAVTVKLEDNDKLVVTKTDVV